MTASTPQATPRLQPIPTQPCAKCEQLHITHDGKAGSCSGHKKGKRDEEGRMLPCPNYPVAGTHNCRMHGVTQRTRAKARRDLALGEAVDALDRLGRPVETTPTEAMLEMVKEAAGNVAFYRARVQELDQLLGGQDAELALAILGSAGKGDYREVAPGPPAIAGRVDPRNWRAERNVLVAMYDEERERLVRWSKACRDAGVEEARVRISEEQGRQLGQVLQATVRGLLDLAVSVLSSTVRDEGSSPGARGALEEALRGAWRDQAPALVRAQIATVTSAEVGA